MHIKGKIALQKQTASVLSNGCTNKIVQPGRFMTGSHCAVTNKIQEREVLDYQKLDDYTLLAYISGSHWSAHIAQLCTVKVTFKTSI